jgi:site-specific recombinase XerC
VVNTIRDISKTGKIGDGKSSLPKCRELNDRDIREMVSRYAYKAGIEKHVNPNMLRHTFAIELLQRL